MSLMIQLNRLASDLHRMETELVTALTHTNHGNISSLILTPKQLRPEIAKIRGHLPIGRALPVEDSDLLELYKIMSIQGIVAHGSVIFIIKLLLVNQKQFELFKILADPTDHSYTNRLANSTLLKKSQSTWFKPHQNQSHNQPYNQDSEV
ncbi:hypothetical protein EVAR_91072_1 [Eumeta japonica]|uniref:Uncharacterized protein n=1 Tax=Eumeta variegata TaxID=151549 RepID=A0A4C2A761_EUMVA|nr:hypothetical protein EVAR_91072_1 [Eumeta japonica]